MDKAISQLPAGMKDTPIIWLRFLTFASFLGMIQKGDYVDVNYLRELLTEMSNSMSQHDLQKWRIQSRFTLPKVFNMILWKLHEDIPYRLSQAKPRSGPWRQPQEWRDKEG